MKNQEDKYGKFFLIIFYTFKYTMYYTNARIKYYDGAIIRNICNDKHIYTYIESI